MSLLPYKVTALARTDSGGENIIPGASVTVLKKGGGYASLYESDLTTPIGNPFTCDSNGERQFWIAGGSYTISVAGGQSWEIRLSGASDIQSVATIADLRALEPIADGQQAELLGHTVAGVGGGPVYYDAADTTTADNNFTVVVTAGGKRWKRKDYYEAHLEDAGAIGTGNSDTAALIACVASGLPIKLTRWYRINEEVPYVSGLRVSGSGVYKSGFIADLPGAADPGGFPSNIFVYPGSGSHTNIHLSNFGGVHSDTTNVKTGLIDTISFTGLYVTDIVASLYRIARCTAGADILRFNNLERLAIPARFDDTFEDGGSALSIQGFNDVIINNVHGDDVAELIDFGIGDNATVECVSAISRAGSPQEAVDMGGVTNITLNNFRFAGFARGVYVKEEATTDCENIVISNGICTGFSTAGVDVFSRARYPVVPALAVVRNVSVSNVICVSDVEDSIALRVTNSGQSSGCDNVTFKDCIGIAEFSAFIGRAFSNLKIDGGYYKSLTNNVVDVRASASETATASDFVITNAEIDGSELSGSSLAAIRIVNVHAPTIKRNKKITASSSFRGVFCIDSRYPSIVGNEFGPCLRFIEMQWSVGSEGWLTNGTDNITNINVTGNKGNEWSDWACYTTWAYTAVPYLGAMYNDNMFLHASTSGTSGIVFGITDQSLAITSVVDNVLRAATPVLNGSRLVAASSTIRNIQNP